MNANSNNRYDIRYKNTVNTRGILFMTNYYERIRTLRKESGLNQTKVASILNIAQTTYSDYEKGKVRMPIELLIQLAKYYDVDMNYICGVSNKKNLFPKNQKE